MGYVGTYDRTIFYNPSNKYCIISVKTSDQSVPQQARSAYRHRDNMIRFIAVGYELPQTDKVSMILDGEWENGKHGVQLQVDKCEEIVPQTKEGVYGYLSSRLIKGVGEKTAALIVNRFGADALRVLENEPERLLEIRGITPDKLEDIKASYAESRCVRDLMILLTPFNVTPVTAMKIYEHFGSRSVDILQKNPYELCQVQDYASLLYVSFTGKPASAKRASAGWRAGILSKGRSVDDCQLQLYRRHYDPCTDKARAYQRLSDPFGCAAEE